MTTYEILNKAKKAKEEITLIGVEQINKGLLSMADSLVENTEEILL